MNRKAILLSLISLLSICSCKANPSSDTSITAASNVINFDIEKFGKENSNIVTMEVLNVPTTPIEIGHFADAKILLKVTYTNEQEETFILNEDFFTKDSLSIISTPGKKHVTILFNQNRVSFDIEMVKATYVNSYKVTFLDFYGNSVYEANVPYLKQAVYMGKSLPDIQDGDYVYTFSGTWSEDVSYVYKNMTVQAKYEKKPYLLRYEDLGISSGLPYLGQYDINYGSSKSDVRYVFYMGRYYNFPFTSSGTYTHNDKSGQKMEFSRNNMFPATQSFYRPNLMNAIYKGYCYESEYITAGGTLDGEDKLYFGEDSFEGIEFEDSSATNETSANANPKFVSNMPDPSFTGYYYPLDGSTTNYTKLSETYYALADKYNGQEITDYIYPNDPYGFYRLVLTCTVDCYIMIDATRTTSYNFDIDDVKFGFFPNGDTSKILKEYSSSSDFDDEYVNPVHLNSNIIYNSLWDAIVNQ